MTGSIRATSSASQPVSQATTRQTATDQTRSGVFADALKQAGAEQDVREIRFSNHAQKRIETRNIAITDDGLSRLANAVEKVEKRGGRESLVLLDDLAFIVNVRERLVITTLDTQERGQGVFTQIDSVVFADSHPSQSTEGETPAA